MAGDSSSKGAVLAALLCNSGLTALKFTAFAFSGSGSMFSEAMHTLADTANQGLLFLGIKRSEKKPDAMFTYGYGGERFLFALLSAVGIFVLGCGVTVYHGVTALIDPHEVDIQWWLFVVLGISFVMNGWVLWKAIQAISKVRGDRTFLQLLRTTSDPTISAVLLEDGIACGGVLIALACIGISSLTGSTVPDAIGSIIIGGLLGFVAIWLGYQNRTLILGRAIPAHVQDAVTQYLSSQPSVQSVRAIQSRIVGADIYKLKAEIDWNGTWFGEQHAEWVAANQALATSDAKSFAGQFGERVSEAIAAEVDRIEAELKAQIPELHFIEFEGDTAGRS
jgi:solute carrier family 30 (zinc transporter), member 9